MTTKIGEGIIKEIRASFLKNKKAIAVGGAGGGVLGYEVANVKRDLEDLSNPKKPKNYSALIIILIIIGLIIYYVENKRG